jgi:hypothetical protein
MDCAEVERVHPIAIAPAVVWTLYSSPPRVVTVLAWISVLPDPALTVPPSEAIAEMMRSPSTVVVIDTSVGVVVAAAFVPAVNTSTGVDVATPENSEMMMEPNAADDPNVAVTVSAEVDVFCAHPMAIVSPTLPQYRDVTVVQVLTVSENVTVVDAPIVAIAMRIVPDVSAPGNATGAVVEPVNPRSNFAD